MPAMLPTMSRWSNVAMAAATAAWQFARDDTSHWWVAIVPPLAPDSVPRQYDSDSLTNYEIGYKTSS
jgi:hypothetical protein